MSLMTFSFLLVLALLMGFFIARGIYQSTHAIQIKKIEEQVTKMKQGMCADVQAQGALISKRLGQLQYGPNHPLAALRSNFDAMLEKELKLAANNPMQVSKIANEMFPDLWLAIGRAFEKNEATQAAAKKQRVLD